MLKITLKLVCIVMLQNSLSQIGFLCLSYMYIIERSQ